MIKRLLPWDGLGHEVVVHGDVAARDSTVVELAGTVFPSEHELAAVERHHLRGCRGAGKHEDETGLSRP